MAFLGMFSFPIPPITADDDKYNCCNDGQSVVMNVLEKFVQCVVAFSKNCVVGIDDF